MNVKHGIGPAMSPRETILFVALFAWGVLIDAHMVAREGFARIRGRLP